MLTTWIHKFHGIDHVFGRFWQHFDGRTWCILGIGAVCLIETSFGTFFGFAPALGLTAGAEWHGLNLTLFAVGLSLAILSWRSRPAGFWAQQSTQDKQNSSEASKPASGQLDELVEELEPIACAANLEIGQAATELVSTASDLEFQSYEIESSTSEAETAVTQATDAVAQVAAALSEMESTIASMMDSVRMANDLAQTTSKQSDDSSLMVERLKSSMEEVESVIGIIEDIARKTNFLALNATIEAARAGAFGKGFAVVAGEVKGLADQTAKSVESVRSQISNIRSIITETVDNVAQMASSAQSSGSAVVQISAALEEQSAIVGEVSRSAQQAADGAQKSSSSTRNVLEIIEEIKPAVRQMCERGDNIEAFLRGVSKDIVELLRKNDSNQQRAYRRYNCNLDCAIKVAETHYSASLLNISYGGAAIASADFPSDCSKTVLEIEGIEFEAEVIGCTSPERWHLSFGPLMPYQAERISGWIRRFKEQAQNHDQMAAEGTERVVA